MNKKNQNESINKTKEKSLKLRMCEVIQQKAYLSEEKIKEALNRKCIRKYAYILHDKDIDEHGNLKEAHWHIMLQFNDSQDTKYIAKWFDIEMQYISKSHSKRFDSMLAYLIHYNDGSKFQYSPQEVKANFDYVAFIQNGGTNSRSVEIIEQILNGTIREFNYTNYITPFEYDKYKKKIDNAFQYRRDKLYTGNREMEVIYITGSSGSGKTTFAKWLAQKKGYSFHVSGSGDDFLDGYKGQDCIILDDIRSSNMKFSEFIKMLDNNTDSNVKSRYHNKYLTECKLLIITCIYDIDNFYNNLFKDNDEPLIQFKRRCKLYLNVNEYYITVYQFDKTVNDYVYSTKYDNPIADLIFKSIAEKKDIAELDSFFCMASRKQVSLDLEKHSFFPF